MGNIQDLLAQILSARYGRDVRQSIHDAIETCYEDGHAGAIDLQARTLLGDTDISGISETVTGAVVELGESVGTAQTTADGAVTAAQAAQSTADGKLSPEDALKAAKASETFTNVTIPSGGDYQFQIPLPDGITNVKPVYARATSLSLACTNMYRVSNTMFVYLSNITNAAITASSVTVEVTYLYN